MLLSLGSFVTQRNGNNSELTKLSKSKSPYFPSCKCFLFLSCCHQSCLGSKPFYMYVSECFFLKCNVITPLHTDILHTFHCVLQCPLSRDLSLSLVSFLPLTPLLSHSTLQPQKLPEGGGPSVYQAFLNCLFCLEKSPLTPIDLS
jgi:hypothetical protein